MKKLVLTVLAAGMAVSLFASQPARAADDDDDDVGYDTKILRSLMGGLGLRRDGEGSGIEYRERSPLVLPPSTTLPPPQADVTPSTANWPVDQDAQRRKEAKKARKNIGGQNYVPEDEARQLTPSQMTPGRATAGRQPTPQTGRGDKESQPGDRLSAKELGYKGNLFSWKTLTGGEDENIRFEGEPGRASLTDPPVGYRTPSAAQPYRVTPDSARPRAGSSDVMTRQTPEEDRR